MEGNHPNIILNYVPGGCTGAVQPCDVGIQRPLKLSMKRIYHENSVTEVLEQIDAKSEHININSRLPTLRDRSTRWIGNAYQAISND